MGRKKNIVILTEALEAKVQTCGYVRIILNGCPITIMNDAGWQAIIMFAKDVNQPWQAETLLQLLQDGIEMGFPFDTTSIEDYEAGCVHYRGITASMTSKKTVYEPAL